MPKETDLMLDDRENADSIESEPKPKHSIDVSSKTQELKFSANDIKVCLKSKKTSKTANKTKREIKQKHMISNRDICAKDVCNTKQKNGYIKSDNTPDNTQPTECNERESSDVAVEDEPQPAKDVDPTDLDNDDIQINPVNGHKPDNVVFVDQEDEPKEPCSQPKQIGLI